MRAHVNQLLKREGVPLLPETGAVGAVLLIVKIQASVIGFGVFVYALETLTQ